MDPQHVVIKFTFSSLGSGAAPDVRPSAIAMFTANKSGEPEEIPDFGKLKKIVVYVGVSEQSFF